LLQNELLERAKLRYGVTSDYALAKKMGVGRNTISSYQLNKTFFDTKTCVTLSHILACTPYEIISRMELERAKRLDKEKLINFWQDEIDNMIGGTL